MYNALSEDKMKDDLKEMERENRTMSEKLKSQITSGKGTDLIYIKYKSVIRWHCIELLGLFSLKEGKMN